MTAPRQPRAGIAAAMGPTARPISFLWLSLALGAGLNGLAQLLLVRHLAPADYGAIAAAFSATAVVSPLASMGLGGHLLQRFGQEGSDARRWLYPSLSCLLVSTGLAAAALTAWACAANSDPEIQRLTLLLIPWCVMQSAAGLMYAVHQVEGRYPQLAAWQIAPGIARLAAAGAAYWSGKGAGLVAGATSVAAAAILIGQSAVFRKLARGASASPGPAAERPTMRSVLAGAWPFAASGSLFLIYYQSDIFILAWLRGPLESAPYAAASLLLTFIYHFPAAVHLQYLAPKLNRWAWHDPMRLRRVQGTALTLVTAFGAACAAALAAVAPRIVDTLFGQAYADAGLYLRWLSLGIPLRYLSIGLGAGLVSPRQVRLRAACQGATALVNVSLNLSFIPRYGALAAVASTIVSEAVLVSLYYWTRRATR